MTRIILIYGAIGAMIVGGLMLLGMQSMLPDEQSMAEGDMMSGLIVGFLTQIVALTTVFLGIKHFRDRMQGGVIKFVPALLVGLGISAVASLGWVFAWEIVLASGFDYGQIMVEMMKQEAVANGLTGAALDQKIVEAQASAKQYMENPVIRLPWTFIEMFPTGVIISLISALFLRNSRFMPARQAVA
jgi:hypothetical protein